MQRHKARSSGNDKGGKGALKDAINWSENQRKVFKEKQQGQLNELAI